MDFAKLKTLLTDSELDCLTVVRMARICLEKGENDSAIAHLMVDSDKLRTHKPELYKFIMAKYTDEQIDRLEELHSKQNNGRGVECVRQMVFYLRHGENQSAETIRQTDGDKITSYPKLEAFCCEMFGCRTHLKKDCDNWLCSQIRKDLAE